MSPISSLSSSVYSRTPDFSSSTSSSSGIVSIIPLLTGLLPFHHFQFLSNLPQYSWSYRLSDHSYNFLAVNLPGSSPRWNVPFSRSYCATSSVSCRYSFSNSSIASFAFFKFSLPSCKGTPNPRLRSLFQSSGAILQPIQYYYVILGLAPIIPRVLRCHPTHFPCSDPSYRCRDTKTL